jgi:hypothetical protein
MLYFPAFSKEDHGDNTGNIEVGHSFVSFTKTFKYLGSLITCKLNYMIDVEARISHRSTKLWEFSRIVSNVNK